MRRPVSPEHGMKKPAFGNQHKITNPIKEWSRDTALHAHSSSGGCTMRVRWTGEHCICNEPARLARSCANKARPIH